MKRARADRSPRGARTRGPSFPNAATEPHFWHTLRSKLSKEQLLQPYAQSPWYYVALRARARTLSQVPFRIYKETGEKGDAALREKERGERIRAVLKGRPEAAMIASLPTVIERFREVRRLAPWTPAVEIARSVGGVEVVTDGEWVELFDTVNPVMTRAQLWEATWLNLGEGGETFWLLEGQSGPVKTPTEVPKEIWPYGRDGWEPVVGERSRRFESWTWKVPGRPTEKPLPIAIHQVLRFYHYSPYGARGLAPFDPIARELRTDFKAQLFNDAFFENGGTPGLYLVYEGNLTDEERRDILDKHEERVRGARKAHRPVLLEGGLKIQEPTTTHREMQFPELRDKTRDVALSAIGTPRAVAGLVEDFNRSNLQGTLRNWWETQLLPDATYAEDLLRSDLFTPKRVGEGGRVFGAFDFSVVTALREDLVEKLDAAYRLWEMGVPLNDVNTRLELGLEEYEWGGIPYKPVGLEPIREEDRPEPPPEPDDDDPPPDDEEDDDEPEKSLRAAVDDEPEVLISDLSSKLASSVDGIRKTLERVLRDAERRGFTREETQAAVRKAFNHMSSGGRVGSSARTATASTVNVARARVFAKENVAKHEWLDAKDSHVRDTHRKYGRRGPVKVGTNFAKGTGYTLRFPHDPKAPAKEVVNCRCVTVPVMLDAARSIFHTDAHWETIRAASFAPGEAAFTAKLRRFLMDLRSAMLKAIADAPKDAPVSSLLFDVKEWREKLRVSTLPVYRKVFAAATKAAEAEVAALADDAAAAPLALPRAGRAALPPAGGAELDGALGTIGAALGDALGRQVAAAIDRQSDALEERYAALRETLSALPAPNVTVQAAIASPAFPAPVVHVVAPEPAAAAPRRRVRFRIERDADRRPTGLVEEPED